MTLQPPQPEPQSNLIDGMKMAYNAFDVKNRVRKFLAAIFICFSNFS